MALPSDRLAAIMQAFRDSETARWIERAADDLDDNVRQGRMMIAGLRTQAEHGGYRMTDGAISVAEFDKVAAARRLELAAQEATARSLRWLVKGGDA